MVQVCPRYLLDAVLELADRLPRRVDLLARLLRHAVLELELSLVLVQRALAAGLGPLLAEVVEGLIATSAGVRLHPSQNQRTRRLQFVQETVESLHCNVHWSDG